MVDTVCTGSVLAKLKSEPEVKVLKSAVSKFCFIQVTLLNDLEDE